MMNMIRKGQIRWLPRATSQVRSRLFQHHSDSLPLANSVTPARRRSRACTFAALPAAGRTAIVAALEKRWAARKAGAAKPVATSSKIAHRKAA
jgi:hypothetical protein